MSLPNAEALEKLVATLQPFIAKLQQEGYNIGVDSYCTVQNLLLALAAQGALSSDFGRLRTLIAPVLCCSQKEQEGFNRYFDDWLQAIQPQEESVSSIVEELIEIERKDKKFKKAYFVFASLALAWIVIYGLVRVYSSNLEISSTIFINISDLTKIVQRILEIVVSIAALWCLSHYAQMQRFLKRHSVLQPPDINKFFLKNQEQNLYSSVDFTLTAQQLHKHRNLDTHLLDVEATVKHTIQQCGFYTPAYKAIKALPEYLILIDRSSVNDQLSHLVALLLKQLDDFGLFIERYYFDGDPRRCYSQRNPTMPCTIENLQSLYANHRLIIFADSCHFFDPITEKLYGWSAKFHEWQSPFLFTLESPQYWNYYNQQLHEAGFVVLTTGKAGLYSLVGYVSADTETAQEQHVGMFDNFPTLLQKRPRRFLERHSPTPEIADELLTQLHDYLGHDGFVWLTACAVYPELHWQLTLYLGKKEGQKQLDEILLLRLARLPWLRYGYMPNWLREKLLLELNDIAPPEEQAIRQKLYVLLLTISIQENVDNFSLTIAQQLPESNFMRDILAAWYKKSADDSPLQDYVFQSFMAERLAVKLPKVKNKSTNKYYNDFILPQHNKDNNHENSTLHQAQDNSSIDQEQREKIIEEDASYEPSVSIKRTYLPLRKKERLWGGVRYPGLFDYDPANDTEWFWFTVSLEVISLAATYFLLEERISGVVLLINALCLFCLDFAFAYFYHRYKGFDCLIENQKRLFLPEMRSGVMAGTFVDYFSYLNQKLIDNKDYKYIRYVFAFLIWVLSAFKGAVFFIAVISSYWFQLAVSDGKTPYLLIAVIIASYIWIAYNLLNFTGYFLAHIFSKIKFNVERSQYNKQTGDQYKVNERKKNKMKIDYKELIDNITTDKSNPYLIHFIKRSPTDLEKDLRKGITEIQVQFHSIYKTSQENIYTFCFDGLLTDDQLQEMINAQETQLAQLAVAIYGHKLQMQSGYFDVN